MARTTVTFTARRKEALRILSGVLQETPTEIIEGLGRLLAKMNTAPSRYARDGLFIGAQINLSLCQERRLDLLKDLPQILEEQLAALGSVFLKIPYAAMKEETQAWIDQDRRVAQVILAGYGWREDAADVPHQEQELLLHYLKMSGLQLYRGEPLKTGLVLFCLLVHMTDLRSMSNRQWLTERSDLQCLMPRDIGGAHPIYASRIRGLDQLATLLEGSPNLSVQALGRQLRRFNVESSRRVREGIIQAILVNFRHCDGAPIASIPGSAEVLGWSLFRTILPWATPRESGSVRQQELTPLYVQGRRIANILRSGYSWHPDPRVRQQAKSRVNYMEANALSAACKRYGLTMSDDTPLRNSLGYVLLFCQMGDQLKAAPYRYESLSASRRAPDKR